MQSSRSFCSRIIFVDTSSVEWTKSIENHGTRGWQSLITEASFQKLHKVGSGSFGSVYQVKKLDTQKIYAMKILSKTNFTEETQLRALSNERKVLEAVRFLLLFPPYHHPCSSLTRLRCLMSSSSASILHFRAMMSTSSFSTSWPVEIFSRS